MTITDKDVAALGEIADLRKAQEFRKVQKLKQEIARLNRKIELLEKTYIAERINGMMPEFKVIEEDLEECYKGEYEEEDDDTINQHKKHEEESHLRYLKFKLKKTLLNKGVEDDL